MAFVAAALGLLVVAAAPALPAALPPAVQSGPAVASAAHAPFVNFESGPVNALLLAPDGRTLCVLNTADDRVEFWDPRHFMKPETGRSLSVSGPTSMPSGVSGGSAGVAVPKLPDGGVAPLGLLGLTFRGAVLTGLSPVAMAFDPSDGTRLFVSNNVSDSVSVVDIVKRQVIATIRVGDEPQGLAISNGRLFVACARAPAVPLAAGQTEPGPLDENVVVVTQASAPWTWLANVPIGAVAPRDVVAANGIVYAIPEHSGNHTTLLDETAATQLQLAQSVPDAFDAPFSVNPVLLRSEFAFPAYTRGWIIPVAGRIVFDDEHPGLVPQLLDRDIVGIDARSLTPQPFATTGVGTTLFDVERNPATGALWVANSDARNRTRFEPALRGAALDNRVSIALAGGTVQQVLELAPPFTPHTHAQPAVIAFGGAASPGPYAFVACLGTASIVVLDAVNAAFVAEIDTGEQPLGLAVDEPRQLLHVFCRGDLTLRSYDLSHAFAPTGPVRHLSYDPEPALVSAGRAHLYDARASTGHGNDSMSCASCHVFGHDDRLAWDLGDPGGSFAYYFPDEMTGLGGYAGEVVTAPTTPILNPLKGPMVTQSLRGLLDPDTMDTLPLHWRGDRRALQQFGGAFGSLLGGTGLALRQVQELSGFLRSLRFPPNPHGPRDRQYTGQVAHGRDLYGLNGEVPGKDYVANSGFQCAKCHLADFDGKTDFTGSRPTVSSGSFTQLFNTAQLRDTYEKDMRDVSGFGALHDGAVNGVRGFMDFVVPNGGLPTFPNFDDSDKDAVAAFVHAWDTGFSSLVGNQCSLSPEVLHAPGGAAQAGAELDLFEAQVRPPASNVDLIVKGFRFAQDGTLLPRGGYYRFDAALGIWNYLFDSGFTADRQTLLDLIAADLATFTFTCVPRGMGERLGLDRDEDGLPDWQEVVAGTNAANPDTDGDGYLDGIEAALGGNPTKPDALLADTTAPVVSEARALEIFAHIASLSCRTDEPATLVVELGLMPDAYTLASVAGPAGGRRMHDVILEKLPAGRTLFFRVRATDRNGNEGTAEGSFVTLPPMLHVADITLQKLGGGPGPVALTARVKVVDHAGTVQAGVPVHGFWAGDIGGQAWEAQASTDAEGWAAFALAPYTPATPGDVSFSPGYIGTPYPNQPFFVGIGGPTPTFFYDQTANAVHYRSVAVP